MSIYLYFLILGFLVYLHRYVYTFGESLLFKYYITNEERANNFSPYKRKYIVKNIWKSMMLLTILTTSTLSFIDGFFNGLWSNLTFFVWGTLYVSLDVAGLYYVRGLPWTTVIHHVVVLVLGTLNSVADYNVGGYYRSILIYTYFSIVPFLVNFYLGYRYLETNPVYKKTLAKVCYQIYRASLGTNLACQVLFFAMEPFSSSIIYYIFLYYLILRDDIKLIRFLQKETQSVKLDN